MDPRKETDVNDPRLGKLAKLLVEYCLAVQPQDLFVIRTSPLATPLVQELVRYALRAGAYPYCRVELEGLQEIFFHEATEELLHFLSPLDLFEIENVNAWLSLLAPFNTKALAGSDPARQIAWQKTRYPITKRYMERDGDGTLRWSVALYPNQANAQDAGMSLADYTEFVFSAVHLDEEDPSLYWVNFSKEQARLSEALAKGSEIRILGPGTDLTVRVQGRKWINSDGHKNMPDGEIFTAPLETSANGHVFFSFPAIYQSREFEGVRLLFRDGEVIKAEARTGEDFLEKILQIDNGARRIGEFAFGTNFGIQQFTKDILFDEKIGGTLHLALGHAIGSTGGTNVSAIHWDMICDLRQDAEVRLDGEVIQRNAQWKI